MLEQSTHDPEEWRPVVGFEGWYEVSDLGRVRNVAKRKSTRVGYVLKPQMDRLGYPRVHLRRQGTNYTRFVHRLVALAFLGLPPNPTDVANHKDTDKSNARPSNLEWITQLENVRHGESHGLNPHASGAVAKLSAADVRLIRATGSSVSQVALARRFGVNQTTISRVLLGRTFRLTQ